MKQVECSRNEYPNSAAETHPPNLREDRVSPKIKSISGPALRDIQPLSLSELRNKAESALTRPSICELVAPG